MRYSAFFLAFFLAVLAPWRSLSSAAPATTQPRPNILLIGSDDQGYADLGCYGATDVKTPRLDALAQQGMRLTSFYVAWPACTPSRASILTGRYPQRNGVYDMMRNDAVNYDHAYTPEEYAVSPEMILGADLREVFISEVLQSNGYTCGIFGKWDLGQLRRYLPLQQGFDDFYGFANTGIDYFTHERYNVPSMRHGNDITTADKGTYSTDLFAREAIRFLKENHRGPFFLYVPFNAPHNASSLDPDIRSSAQAPQQYLDLYPQSQQRHERRRRYMAAVTAMDHAIAQILDTLDELKVADNTIVIFFSDNGGGTGASNAPLRGRKGTLLEGGIRVPCLIRWPNQIPPNTTRDDFLTTLELFPTLLTAANIAPPADVTLDGFNMLPTLKGESPSPRTEMFWQRRNHNAARVGQYKWLDTPTARGLYDLSTDPAESSDLSAEHPDIVQRLQTRFSAWRTEMDAADPRGPFRDF